MGRFIRVGLPELNIVCLRKLLLRLGGQQVTVAVFGHSERLARREHSLSVGRASAQDSMLFHSQGLEARMGLAQLYASAGYAVTELLI